MDVETYDAWYHTPRGVWIGSTEFALLLRLLPSAINRNENLLDLGCGTGYFTRRFLASGRQVMGLDPDESAVRYALKQNLEKRKASAIYLRGEAEGLPFADNSVDYCTAITSLCFVSKPEKALQEMWRVAAKGILLGLLNRHSLLYWLKRERGAYRGARWDTSADIREWIKTLSPMPIEAAMATAVFMPGGGVISQAMERVLPSSLPWGSFLAIYIEKKPGY